MALFKTPKAPTPPPPPNPAITAVDAEADDADLGLAARAGSLIGTSARGLKRRATTERTSLIGG